MAPYPLRAKNVQELIRVVNEVGYISELGFTVGILKNSLVIRYLDTGNIFIYLLTECLKVFYFLPYLLLKILNSQETNFAKLQNFKKDNEIAFI
jgi:hypothetical protein